MTGSERLGGLIGPGYRDGKYSEPSEHIVFESGVQGVEELSREDEGEVEGSNSGQLSKYEIDAGSDKRELWHNALLQDEQTPVDGIYD